MTSVITNPLTGVEVMDPENLSDAEARQRRYMDGVAVMRTTDRELAVPARAVKDGRIFLTEGRVRGMFFENQDTNLIELTTEASLRFEDAVEDAEDDVPDGKNDDERRTLLAAAVEAFTFEVTLDDLTVRRAAFVHGKFAAPREARFADSPFWAKPIIGLDVDEDGAAIPIKALRKALRKARRDVPQAGFTAATGGAFED